MIIPLATSLEVKGTRMVLSRVFPPLNRENFIIGPGTWLLTLLVLVTYLLR